LEFRVGLGFKVLVHGRVQGLGFSGFRVKGFECRISGFEFGITGLGVRVENLGFRVKGQGLRI
jgi:acylphosphatase